MTEPIISADTARLRAEAFASYLEHMKGVVDEFDAERAANAPVVLSVRGEVDEAIVKDLDRDLPETLYVLTGLRDLSLGDGSRVEELRVLLESYEAGNVDTAGSWGGDGPNLSL
ncbi:hypothetical protein [Micromonospora sp. NBC_01796]|uniref:hypothetical protein n=1 Tax=Micromonospora sp. NBC_01796 TaxID=2975987 RepID=UPI002DDC8BFE|nr:hypothetical protein [Micromonospora sp. NBC_01796]WSA84556.1 hypothetical protein OIE47_30000 [Micromonospora sp. NBC_01796]